MFKYFGKILTQFKLIFGREAKGTGQRQSGFLHLSIELTKRTHKHIHNAVNSDDIKDKDADDTTAKEIEFNIFTISVED